jgi:hypothetical protein
MRSENVFMPTNAERPLIARYAPYDPPEPAPQAAAWRLALKVIGCAPPARHGRIAKTTVRRVKWG